MARESKSKEIDGMTFTVPQLPGKRGNRMAVRLIGMLAPMAAKALGGGKLGDIKNLKNLELTNLSDAVQMLADKMTPEQFEAMQNELLEEAQVVVDGNQIRLMPVFDNLMAGKALTSFKLFSFALEVNFGNFFDGGLAAGLQSLMEPPSKA